MSADECSPSAIASAMPPPPRRLDHEADVAVRACAPARQEQATAQPPSAATSHAVEQDALTALIAEHQVHVRRLVFRLLGWRDACCDDIVQEVFLAAWRHRQALRKVRHVERWLKRVAINKCRSRLRREAIRRRWLFWMRKEPALKPQSFDSDGLAIQETSQRVRDAISALDVRYRELVVLRYLESLSIAEIVEFTGTRRNTVEVRLHRARAQLGKALTDLL